MKTNNPIDFLLEMLETQGVAASSVTDGHILLFKKKFLQDLLDQNAGKEKIIIFVKQQEFKN
jgi:hypothetical protein